MRQFRIAAYGGFRSIPPRDGSAGSDKFALELYPRLAKKYSVIAYCRIYPDDSENKREINYQGIKLKYFKTVKMAGFDSLIHSLKATFDVICNNTADIVHLHSGANSIWAFILRLAGKKVYVSQFAMDWKRDKWPWYAKLFFMCSNYFTAYLPNGVIFDNIFTKDYFEKKFRKEYSFIPYGSEVIIPKMESDILQRLNVAKEEYFLFIGRFIPDKGIHLLIEAFEKTETVKKLILIGGCPNPSNYEIKLKSTCDDRIIFPGFLYGDDTNILIKNAFVYIQPSIIEGLSPVILTVMGLGTPLICSDIKENQYIARDNAIYFTAKNAESLKIQIAFVLQNPELINKKAQSGRIDVLKRFNWDAIADQFAEVFINNKIVKTK